MLMVTFTSPAQERASLTLVGRLATVEPANRRVTIVPNDEAKWVEVFLDENGEVEDDTGTLTLADLVIHVGRRVTVTYHVVGERRLADTIIVEPD